MRHAGLRSLLLVGLTQLQYTRAKPYAVVDHAVQAASRLGQPAARGLVNAVLRNYQRKRVELGPDRWQTPEVRYGHPAWWVEKLRLQHPEHWNSMLASANIHPPLTLRVNRRKATVESVMQELRAAEIPATALGGWAIRMDPRPVAEIPGFAEGRVSIQDAGAQRAADLLAPKDGERILDACAAPGGKTTHLLEIADAEVTALDLDDRRLDRVRQNLSRLDLCAKVVAGDASQPNSWWDGHPFQSILLDAPCSASGVTRRHPDIRWNRRPSDLLRFSQQQVALLSNLWQVLEPGGKLLYATCSVFREENDAAVEEFLAATPNAELVTHAPEGQAMGQLIPDDDHDGFYYALLRKR